MPRGYRCILVAFVGWLALSGQAPNPGAKPEKPKAEANQAKSAPSIPPPSNIVTEPPQPAEYYRPCGNDGNNGNSDLCAQWTAAESAHDAAYWAKMAFWAGVASLLGLGWTLWETRRTANAGIAAVKEAQRSNDAQLRPYPYVDKVRPIKLDPVDPKFAIHLRNFGQTPAKNGVLKYGICSCPTGQVIYPIPNVDMEFDRDVPPGHMQKLRVYIPATLKGDIPKIAAKTALLVVVFVIDYDIAPNQRDRLRGVIIYDEHGPRGPAKKDHMG